MTEIDRPNPAKNVEGASSFVSGPRPRFGWGPLVDNIWGELHCPECNRQNMQLMGIFSKTVPHLRCQQCWADAIFVLLPDGGVETPWRSKEERLAQGSLFTW